MKPPLWTSLAIVIGLVLMLVGPLLVSYLLPPEALWTDADAEKLSQASAKLHAAIHASLAQQGASDHEHVGAGKVESVEPTVPDLATAQREYDEQEARLERARAIPNLLWYGASIAGALLAAVGVVGHWLAGRARKSP